MTEIGVHDDITTQANRAAQELQRIQTTSGRDFTPDEYINANKNQGLDKVSPWEAFKEAVRRYVLGKDSKKVGL